MGWKTKPNDSLDAEAMDSEDRRRLEQHKEEERRKRSKGSGK